jgi:hypothetical protein
VNDMPSKCSKCGSKDNYNFALNIGLCNICISKELERIIELEENIRYAIGGIEALSAEWKSEAKKDIEAIKQTLEQNITDENTQGNTI